VLTGLLTGSLACSEGGSETGNPVATNMGLGLRSGDPEQVGIGSGSAGVVLEAAWLAIGEVTLLGEGECANLGEIDVFGRTAIAADLVRGDARFTLDVAARSYCGLALPLNLNNSDLPQGAPAALADHSIVLSGHRADGVRFELLHSEQDTIELAADAGEFAIEADGSGLLLSFDVAVWMEGLDFDAAEIGDDGVIHIDVSANRALLDAYEANLECSLELFADADDDGALGSGDPRLARCFED
jgi:hypothetical protein